MTQTFVSTSLPDLKSNASEFICGYVKKKKKIGRVYDLNILHTSPSLLCLKTKYQAVAQHGILNYCTDELCIAMSIFFPPSADVCSVKNELVNSLRAGFLFSRHFKLSSKLFVPFPRNLHFTLIICTSSTRSLVLCLYCHGTGPWTSGQLTRMKEEKQKPTPLRAVQPDLLTSLSIHNPVSSLRSLLYSELTTSITPAVHVP